MCLVATTGLDDGLDAKSNECYSIENGLSDLMIQRGLA